MERSAFAPKSRYVGTTEERAGDPPARATRLVWPHERPARSALASGSEGAWVVDDMIFPARGAPQPGLTKVLLYRPLFTVRQFPPAGHWRSDDPVRLFVSCDHWAGRRVEQARRRLRVGVGKEHGELAPRSRS